MSPPPRQPSLNILKQSLVDVPKPYRSLNARTAAGGCPFNPAGNRVLTTAGEFTDKLVEIADEELVE